MRSLLSMFLIAVVILFVWGCGPRQTSKHTKIIEMTKDGAVTTQTEPDSNWGTTVYGRAVEVVTYRYVARIMRNDECHHTLFVHDDANPDRYVPIGIYAERVVYYTDVPDTAAIWVRLTRWQKDCINSTTAEVHLHRLSDLNAGGWNHGKFGNGMNVVIE